MTAALVLVLIVQAVLLVVENYWRREYRDRWLQCEDDLEIWRGSAADMTRRAQVTVLRRGSLEIQHPGVERARFGLSESRSRPSGEEPAA